MDWYGVEQGFDVGQDDCGHDASGRNVEASGAITTRAPPQAAGLAGVQGERLAVQPAAERLAVVQP